MEKVLFADTFTKTFKNVLKVPNVIIDDPIFRMHYKFTGLALLFASILVSGYQFFGNPIMCIQKDDIPEQLLNTYCWIEGTFTLPKALFKKVGSEVVYPGVDKYLPEDELVEHTFYQWVCFVLFIQALMFCVPHVVWKTVESGRMKNLVQKLRNPCLVAKDRKPCFIGLAHFFQSHRFEHQYYAAKFLMCETLNLVNVILQIYFINLFLGGEFTKYGVDVIRYANEEQENRIDPMIRVFPKITKCTFHKYGSSGDVQRHDALCLLPLNILNEKIYIVMWFWFIILAILDGGLLLFRLVAILSKRFRYLLLRCVTSLTAKDVVDSLIKQVSYGDWFLLYILADNIENIHFRQFAIQLEQEGVHKHAKCMTPDVSISGDGRKKSKTSDSEDNQGKTPKAIEAGLEKQQKLSKADEALSKDSQDLYPRVDMPDKGTKFEHEKDFDGYDESYA